MVSCCRLNDPLRHRFHSITSRLPAKKNRTNEIKKSLRKPPSCTYCKHNTPLPLLWTIQCQKYHPKTSCRVRIIISQNRKGIHNSPFFLAERSKKGNRLISKQQNISFEYWFKGYFWGSFLGPQASAWFLLMQIWGRR